MRFGGSESALFYMMSDVKIYLVDGTYELFRHYFAVLPARDADGNEVGAVRGVLASVLGMIREGATHIAVATITSGIVSQRSLAGIQD